MGCISRFAVAILSGETELALGTIRVKIGMFSYQEAGSLFKKFKSMHNFNISKLLTDMNL